MENIGASQLKNAEEQVKILDTNMSLKEDKKRRKELFGKVVNTLGYTTDQLVTDNKLNRKVLKGSEISVMVATNTEIVDEAIGMDDRILTQAVMYAYA